MLWVVIMVAIAVIGLVMVICYARWLWHKASDLMAEVGVLLERLGQLGDLLAQIQPPTPRPDPSEGDWADEEGDEDDDWSADARELRRSLESAASSAPDPAARHAHEPEPVQTT